MNKLNTHCVGFDRVEVGEFFQWGSRDGEVYVKIMVQKYRNLTPEQKKRKMSIWDFPDEQRYEFHPAALNVRTFQTRCDIQGGNIQCVRLKGYISAEVHKEME